MRSRGSGILLGLALLLAAGGGFVAGVYQKFAVPLHRFTRYQDRIERMITDLTATPPNDVSRVRWDTLCQTCQIASGNALYSPSHVPVEEVVRLEADLRRYLDEHPEPDVQTLIWFWDRLGECSWHANKYVVHFRPLLDDALNAAESDRR